MPPSSPTRLCLLARAVPPWFPDGTCKVVWSLVEFYQIHASDGDWSNSSTIWYGKKKDGLKVWTCLKEKHARKTTQLSIPKKTNKLGKEKYQRLKNKKGHISRNNHHTSRQPKTLDSPSYLAYSTLFFFVFTVTTNDVPAAACACFWSSKSSGAMSPFDVSGSPQSSTLRRNLGASWASWGFGAMFVQKKGGEGWTEQTGYGQRCLKGFRMKGMKDGKKERHCISFSILKVAVV